VTGHCPVTSRWSRGQRLGSERRFSEPKDVSPSAQGASRLIQGVPASGQSASPVAQCESHPWKTRSCGWVDRGCCPVESGACAPTRRARGGRDRGRTSTRSKSNGSTRSNACSDGSSHCVADHGLDGREGRVDRSMMEDRAAARGRSHGRADRFLSARGDALCAWRDGLYVLRSVLWDRGSRPVHVTGSNCGCKRGGDSARDPRGL